MASLLGEKVSAKIVTIGSFGLNFILYYFNYKNTYKKNITYPGSDIEGALSVVSKEVNRDRTKKNPQNLHCPSCKISSIDWLNQ